MINFDAAHKAVHYPPDRRFRVWLKPSVVGTVLVLVKQAELVDGADKLLKLQVDVGEPKPRQIFAGIRADYPDPSVLVGKNVIVVANLKPRQMKFGLSEGMVLAAGEKPQTLSVEGAQPGDKVS